MLFSAKQKCLLTVLLIGIYLCAFSIQANLLIKGDVIWLFDLADKVLHGGKYLQDFFEINPPLSIYIYIPAVLISKIFFLSPIHSARSYVFGLSLCSLFLCYLQINKIFDKKEALGALVLLLSIAFIFIITPMTEFGQRENLLVILTLPYFLNMVCRIEKKPVSTGSAILIGIMAGIGFAIKPFYIISLLFIEIYYLFTCKKIRCLLRSDTITMAVVVSAYLLIVFYFNRDYLYGVVPVAAMFYYISFASSLWHSFENAVVYYMLFALGLHVVQYRYLGKNLALANILILAMSGFLVGYLLQRIPWYYHIYPAYSLAILYFMTMFYLLAKNVQPQTKNIPALFYFAIVMWITLIFAYSTAHIIWYFHFFTVLSLLLYSYYAWLKQLNTFKTAFLIGLMLIFFTFPTHFYLQLLQISYTQKSELNGLIHLLHTQKNKKSIYFFSSMSAYMVSVFEHANVKHASRLQFLAWMRFLYNNTPYDQNRYKKPYQQVNDFFIHLLVSDMNKNKPDWILVDEQYYNGPQGKMSINYLAYLEKNPSFQSAWSAYHYIGTVNNPAFPYSFKIYSRN